MSDTAWAVLAGVVWLTGFNWWGFRALERDLMKLYADLATTLKPNPDENGRPWEAEDD